MILFKEDWDKYPNAHVHLETRNKSFIKYAKLLKKMGVDNHLFPLALHFKELKDYSPYDEDLPDRIKLLMIAEIKINPWYYFRECVKVNVDGHADPIYLRANRGNIALFWSFFVGLTILMIQIRQTGKTLNTGALYNGLMQFWTVNSKISVLTKDSKLQAETIDKIKDIALNMPAWLRTFDEKKDIANNERMTVKAMGKKGTGLNTYLAQASKAAALNLGRGMTSPTVGVDELAYGVNYDISIPVLLGSGNEARTNAEKAGMPHGIIMYTTAGMLNTAPGRFAHKLYRNGMKFNEKLLYDARNKEHAKQIVRMRCREDEDLVVLDFNHRQLGKTDEWLRKTIKTNRVTGDKLLTDYFGIWVQGGTSSPIDSEILKIINKSKKEPEYIEILEGGFSLNHYVKNRNDYLDTSVIIGLDTSDAIGKDEIGLVGRHPMTGEVLFACSYNKVSTNDFAIFLAYLMMKYKKSVLVFERKSTGLAIVDTVANILLSKNENPFKRIFNNVVDDYDIKPERFKALQAIKSQSALKEFYIQHRKEFGYNTSAKGKMSRNNLYVYAMPDSLKYTADKVYDKDLIEQFNGLQVKNGRIDHGDKSDPNVPGDDSVIAYLLGWWFLRNGKMLSYYGIKNAPLTGLVDLTDERTEEEKLEDEKRKQLIDELNKQIELLSTAKGIKRDLILAKIRTLKSEIGDVVASSLNIESRIEEAIREDKKDKKPIKRYNNNIIRRLIA